jgi:glucose/mannose-6-phosphate isomerase
MMHDALKKFPEQLGYNPKIFNAEKLSNKKQLVICGMGGSHLSADIFNLLVPGRIRLIHSDYGLPELSEEEMRDCLFVMSSYSGNTEEVLESYDAAKVRGLSVCAMAVGGKLIERVVADGIPYIQFPDVGIQPRAALGFGVQALLAFAGEHGVQNELRLLLEKLDVSSARAQGEILAHDVKGKIPLVYASGCNGAIAQNWKIKFNENTKIPAFWNVIPELNHNEMTGFDLIDSTRELSQKFFVILLQDSDEHPRNTRRFEVVRDLYTARGIEVCVVEMKGATRAEKIFSCLMLGDWTSVLLGELYGVETEQVPMVEEFKKML